ncbi:uncharacterized protein LOC110008059 isoform X2 [Amborella trichopoda]|uniref:uncharacterized protein LOC110008059 isoform X2 n=1 Tax=Amborella trichopoda TaxID=13333 RepID=UPI0009C140BA|nr:uncharacterized protein LOC110008059 isoform X2 [Amborella trichopoda]|eukprot:XP_020528875.1 uncharacterized protein LOC110008059 isoform X2 [Amborella trichopoda]
MEILNAAADAFELPNEVIEEGKSLIEALPRDELYESDRVMRDLEHQILITILAKLCFEEERVVIVIGEASSSNPIAEVVGEASS